MKKKENTYSVIIVGGAASTKKEFIVSSRLIRNSITVFCVFLLILGFVTFDYLTISFDKEKMKHLERDNAAKKKAIAKYSRSMRNTEEKLTQMALYKDKISVVIGITSLESLNDVGTGGGDIFGGGQDIPVSTAVSKPKTMDKNLKTEPPTESILKKAESLRKQAQDIQDRLQSVEKIMESQKIRLASTPSIWPTKGYLTSSIGLRIHPLTGKQDHHTGQDIAAQYGSKVFATADGTVIEAGYGNYLGNLIIIDHGFGFTSRYGHLASFNVKVGERVKRFQVIGYVGNSGRSSAPHLHYEVRYYEKPQNPMNFIID